MVQRNTPKVNIPTLTKKSASVYVCKCARSWVQRLWPLPTRYIVLGYAALCHRNILNKRTYYQNYLMLAALSGCLLSFNLIFPSLWICFNPSNWSQHQGVFMTPLEARPHTIARTVLSLSARSSVWKLLQEALPLFTSSMHVWTVACCQPHQKQS